MPAPGVFGVWHFISGSEVVLTKCSILKLSSVAHKDNQIDPEEGHSTIVVGGHPRPFLLHYIILQPVINNKRCKRNILIMPMDYEKGSLDPLKEILLCR